MCGTKDILKKQSTLYDSEKTLNFCFYTVYFGNNLLLVNIASQLKNMKVYIHVY